MGGVKRKLDETSDQRREVIAARFAKGLHFV